MTTASQAVARIREALEKGPTDLAWIVTSAADIFPEGGNYLIASCGGNSGLYRNHAANSRYIAACSPDSLRAILDDRDALRTALEMLYAEAADYIRLNNLGGMDNQCMRLARAAIAAAPGGEGAKT